MCIYIYTFKGLRPIPPTPHFSWDRLTSAPSFAILESGTDVVDVRGALGVGSVKISLGGSRSPSELPLLCLSVYVVLFLRVTIILIIITIIQATSWRRSNRTVFLVCFRKTASGGIWWVSGDPGVLSMDQRRPRTVFVWLDKPQRRMCKSIQTPEGFVWVCHIFVGDGHSES